MKKTPIYAVSCAFLALTACNQPASKQVESELINPSLYQELPFQMEKVAQPSFNSYEVNIVDFGAKAGGLELCTDAINNAIKAVNEKGGGKVIIPAGLWLTGPIVLQSNVNLYTEKNSLVVFSGNHDLYPIILSSFEGWETRRCQSPISARDAENIAITGYGTFDGNGDTWRPVKKGKMTANQWNKLLASGGMTNEKGDIWFPSESAHRGYTNAAPYMQGPDGNKDWQSVRDFLRPVMVSLIDCNKVLLEGITFKNSPAWCIHPLSCEDITLNKVGVSNPWYSQNGDALDLESCNRALVVNCLFDAGDDAICIKSGKDEEGRRRGEPCQNVIVKDNVVLHGHGGFVVGSEMSGGVKNIYVDNCTFLGTDVGLRFKSRRGRGGVVENIHISNINMINIPAEAILFDLFYGGKSALESTADDEKDKAPVIPPVTEETPSFRDIYINNVTCKGSGRAVFFNGIPEMPIKNINIDNIIVTDAEKGIVLNQAEDVKINNVTIRTLKPSPTVSMTNLKNVTINGETFESIDAKGKELNF